MSEVNKESVDFEARSKTLEEENEKLKLALTETQKREKLLMRRIHLKEQQIQDYVSQLSELKSSIPAKSNLVDPAINLIFMKLKNELKATKAKLEDTQNELTAWKFTPDSNTGKRLMAKCRLLYQENEELGKIVSNGRLAKLESDLSLHRNMCDELKRSQSDVEGIIQDLDVDVEGLTSTIILLQQKLKTSDEKIAHLEAEVKKKEPPSAAEVQEENKVEENKAEEETEEPSAKKPCLEVAAH